MMFFKSYFHAGMSSKDWLGTNKVDDRHFSFFSSYFQLLICWLLLKSALLYECHIGGKGETGRVSLAVQWFPTKMVSRIIAIRLWTPSDSNLGEGLGYVLTRSITNRERPIGRDLFINCIVFDLSQYKIATEHMVIVKDTSLYFKIKPHPHTYP